MSVEAAKLLPSDLLGRASLRGNEYAWRIEDIPAVIDAAVETRLINVGGQLQFRVPEGGTCECYWVQVDAIQDLPKDLNWPDRVRITASAARQQFDELKRSYDFLDEGKKGFGGHFEEIKASDGAVADAMCFVWYVDSEQSYSNSTIT